MEVSKAIKSINLAHVIPRRYTMISKINIIIGTHSRTWSKSLAFVLLGVHDRYSFCWQLSLSIFFSNGPFVCLTQHHFHRYFLAFLKYTIILASRIFRMIISSAPIMFIMHFLQSFSFMWFCHTVLSSNSLLSCNFPHTFLMGFFSVSWMCTLF